MKAIISLVISSFFVIACGKTVDNTVLEASRMQRIDYLAANACDRAQACEGFGSEKSFTTRDECVAKYRERAEDYWPAKKCGAGKMNDGKYEICMDRVKKQACTGKVWDTIVAMSECGARTVCTDRAH